MRYGRVGRSGYFKAVFQPISLTPFARTGSPGTDVSEHGVFVPLKSYIFTLIVNRPVFTVYVTDKLLHS